MCFSHRVVLFTGQSFRLKGQIDSWKGLKSIEFHTFVAHYKFMMHSTCKKVPKMWLFSHDSQRAAQLFYRLVLQCL